MPTKRINLTISRENDNLIDCTIYLNSVNNAQKLPILIFAHGFKGFKDWGGFPYYCEKLAAGGFAVLSFNFSYNGVEKASPMDFTRLDLFAENTHSTELTDISTVINYLPQLSEKFPGKIDITKVGMIGHSRGGGIAVIAAAEHPQIKALLTLASVGSFDRYTEEQKKRWREKGYIEMPNTRTNQLMKMNVSLLNDIENNSKRLDIQAAASDLKIPFLIIHGKEDLAVKYADAEKIYSAADKERTKLVIIENTGHTFGVEHPFKGTTNAFEEVIKLTADFFTKNLQK